MYKVYNNIEDEILFNGNEREFIQFMNLIKSENYDYEITIIEVSEAIEYLEKYCGNLDLIT